MKINPAKIIPILIAGIALLMGLPTQAANITKLNSTDMSAATGWSAVPAGNDIGEFNAIVSAPNLAALTLNGANLTLGGLQLDNNLNGPLTIALGNTLTLSPTAGATLPGIDMSAANQDLTINCLLNTASNQTWTVASGRTLTLGTNVTITAAKQLNITNNGSIVANGTAFGFGTVGAGSGLILAGAGSFIATNATVQVFSSQTTTTLPTPTTPVPAPAGTGFVVNGETVSVAQVMIGTGNSGCSMLVNSGSLTCSGPVLIGNSSSGSRWTYCEVTGGTFTVNDTTTGLQMNKQKDTTHIVVSELYIHGGSTVNLGKLTFGDSGNTLADANWLIVGTNGNTGSLYIGSGGMVLASLSGLESVNCSLYGGTLGANANWTSSSGVPMQLSGPSAAPFIIQAADSGSTAHDITLNGPISGGGSLTKTGNGTLTLAGINTYTGNTLVNAGELAGVTGGSISNTAAINFAAGTKFGVKLAPAGGQFVVTNVAFTNVSYIDFNLNAVTPSLTVAPLRVLGDLPITNAVGFVFRNGSFAAGTYPLITYTGNLVGSVTNMPLGSLPGHSAGYISNDVVNTKTIYLVVTNGSSEPLHWAVGSGNWDVGITANWQDVNSAVTTYQEPFGVGDQVIFDDRATVASPTVTVTTNVFPLSVIITNSARAYTFSGSGSIGGSIALTKSGNGSLTLANSNSFTGGISLNGGTTVFSTLSSLGAGAVSFGGGTLQFAPGNTADISLRTVIFNAGGSIIDDNGQNLNFANPIGNGGTGGFTKVGAGTMTLHGGNSFNGDALITQGMLVLASGAGLPRSTNIVVSSGATYDVSAFGIYHLLVAGISQTLSGSGSINVNGTAYVDAGTFISPGNGTNSVGTLTFNTYTSLQISGSLLMNVTTIGSDLIVADDATINAGVNLYIYSSGLTNGNYELLRLRSSYIDNGFTLHFSQPNKVGSLVWIGNSLYLEVSDQATDNLTWSGTGSTWDQSGTTDWYLTGSATPWAFTNGDIVRFDETGSANPGITLNGVLQPSLVVVTNPVTDYAFNDGGSAKLSVSASLLKQGAGNLTINTLNDNTGGTTIQGGTVTVIGSIGSGPVTNNSHLVLQQSSPQMIASITGTGDVTQNGASTTVSGAGNYTGPTTLTSGTLAIGSGGSAGAMATSAITNNSQLALNSSTDWNYSMPDTGTGDLRKLGTNTLTMSGVNARTGNTRVDSGKVVLANANQLQSGSVELEGTGILDMNGHDQNVAGLTGSSFGALIVNNAGTATNLLIINSTASGPPQCEARVVNNQGSGGAIAVLKMGAGELYWRGTNNTYSGGTEVREGLILVNSSDLFGSGPVNLSGGGLDFTGGSPTNTINLFLQAGATTSSLRCAGNITFMAPVVGTNNVQVNMAPGLSSSLTFRQSGGAAQWAGVTGTVLLRSEDPTKGGFFRADAAVNMSGAIVDMNDSQVTFNCNSSAQNVQIGALVGNTSSAGLSPSSGSTFSIGAKNLSTAFAGGVTGAGNLVKVGSGTLTLTGTNSATGSLTVSNGTLVLSGDGAPSSKSVIKVASGATLDVSGLAGSMLSVGPAAAAQTLTGSGTVIASVVVGTNGTVNSGDGIGALTVTGNLTLGGTLVMELNTTNAPATNDTLVVGGTLNIGGTLTVTNLGPALQGGNTFKLFSTGVSGFTATNLPGLTGSLIWSNSIATDGKITVINPVNPNPPVMGISVSGNVMTLSWPTNSGWMLQQQTNSLSVGLGTNWVDVPSSTSITSTNITINPAGPTVFYRLKL